MTDIVELLTEPVDDDVSIRVCRIMDDAADEITALRARVAELEAALIEASEQMAWAERRFHYIGEQYPRSVMCVSVDRANRALVKKFRAALRKEGSEDA